MADTEVTAPQEQDAEEPKEEKSGLSTAARRHAKAGRTRHSKRYLALAKNLDSLQIHELDNALTKVKELATAKFDETVEAAVNLGVDPRHGDQMVRGTTSLPYGTGKSRVVWVFARGEKAEEARAAGADVVGAEDLVERIQKEGGANCDILVATPDVMPLVGRLGQILKQKMPNPKAGTVSPNAGQVVKEIKGATRAEYRVDKNGIVHAPIGKASYPVEHLHANFIALLNALIKAKPSASKGKYLKKITLASTMGPGLAVDVAEVQKLAEHI
jgi:large subunit ribosomal protein L1